MRDFSKATTAGSLEPQGRVPLPLRATFVLAACVAALLLGAPGAKAATAVNSYAPAPLPTFGVEGSKADATGVGDLAVSSGTGNIFVPKHFWGDVVVFEPNIAAGGVPLSGFESLSTATVDPQNVAVDPSDDTVYVDDSMYSFGIAKFVSDGQPTPTYTYDPSFAPTVPFNSFAGVAVVPGSGNVLVVDSTANKVYELAASDGHELLSVEGFQGARSVAAGPSGAFYVVDYAARRVERFAADGTFQGDLPLPSGAQPSAITANAVNGDVAVAVQRAGQIYIDGFAADGTPKFSARVTSSITPGGGRVTGIAWDGGSGRIYVSTLVNGEAGQVATFVPALQPGVDAPTGTLGRNTAHISAEIAAGGDDTTAYLEYCLSTEPCASYGISNPGDPANPWKRGPEHEHLTSTETIEDDLPLSSNATWQVRVFARDNVTATDNTSEEATFDSPLLTPGSTTGPAGSIGESQAELTGSVDTMGVLATYHFEYGLTSSYGSQVPAAGEAPAGNGRAPRPVTQMIEGLQPGTTYHYRLVARNSEGESVGSDRTFTTAASGEFPARNYEQVTPIDKEGAQVASEFHVQLDPGGSWIAVATASGTTSDEGVKMRQNYLVRREAGDWSDWFPIEAPQKAAGGIFESSTTGVSADGDYALVASNKVLAPGGIDGGGNLYVKDLRTGAYTFVAGGPGNDTYNQLANGLANEVIFASAAPNFSWILFWSPRSLSPEAPGSAMYRWTRSDGLSIESQIPNPVEPAESIVSPEAQLPDASQTPVPTSSPDGRVVAFGSPFGVFIRSDGVSTAISISHRTEDLGAQYPARLDGMSANGRYVFFHTPFHLTEDTPEDINGQAAVYRYDTKTGQMSYTLSVAKSSPLVGLSANGDVAYFETTAGIQVWHEGAVHTISSEVGVSSAEGARYATQNGRYFAWKGFDRQAHLYDLDTNESVCVSCSPKVAIERPAFIGLPTRTIGNTMPAIVAEDGTMFFDTATPLVSADHNGKRDVYAYREGRLALISPGDANFDAVFVGATENGRNVYLETDQSLVSQDVDGYTDVYDARVGGGFPGQSPPPSAATCVRAECGEASSGPVNSPEVTGPLPPRKVGAQLALTIGKVSFNGGAIRVRFHASGAGRVKVGGPRVRTTSRRVPRAGSYSVTVPLTNAARASLKDGKKVTVAVTVSLTGNGETSTAKKSLAIGK